VLDRFGQDIGTGSGFLAMLAAKYGAKKVLSAVLARAMVAREAFQSS
jgi:predicted RNA methylase